MKLSAIKKSVADGAGVTGQTLIYDSAVSTGSNTYLPTGLYGDSIEGTYAFTTNQDRLYLHTGQGWFQVSTINTNPSFTTGLNASYTLATDATAYKNGTATNIEVLATDPEGFDVTYTATGNTAFNNIAHLERTAGHDSAKGRFFTIEPKTQDSAGSATPDNGTLTITASDGINTASTTGTFDLTFDVSIANSQETQLMLLGVGNGKNNNTVIHDAGLQNSKTVTRGGTSSELLQGSYSPYAPTGYSMYFDGSGDKASIAGSSDFNLLAPSGTSNNFTIEMWLYKTVNTGGSDYDGLLYWDVNNRLKFQGSNSIINFEIDGTELTIVNGTHNFMNNWSHLAIVREGTSIKTYVNGVLQTTHTNSGAPGGTDTLIIGENTSNVCYGGFIKDLRIVKGTAVYTGNFTPNRRPLTVTGGGYDDTTNVNIGITASHTKLLACTLPYLRDASSSRRLITVTGSDTKMVTRTPYRTSEAYDASKHGGSVFCPSGEYISVSDHADFDLGTDDFCIEWWMNLSGHGSGTPCIFTHGWGSPGNFCPFIFGLGLGDGSTSMTHFAQGTTGGNWSLSGGYTTSGEGSGNDHPALPISLHCWYHIAFVRNGNSIKLYANGVEYASQTSSIAYSTDAGNVVLGAAAGGSYSSAQIFFSDVRIHVGDPVYTGNFTPPTGPLTLTGGTYSDTTNVDTSLTSNNTKLLFNFTNAGMIEAGGRFNFKQIGDDVTSDNTNTKWGSGVPSVHFGGSGDLLTIEDGGAGISGLPFNIFFGAQPPFYNSSIGTSYGSDLVMDGWVYFDGAPSSQEGMFHLTTKTLDTSAVTTGVAMGINASAGNEYWRYYYASTSDNASTKASTTTWYHFALQRSGGLTRLYINGTEIASQTDTGDYSSLDAFNIGGYYTTSFTIDGRFSDFRYTRQSRYPFIPLEQTVTSSTSYQTGITATPSNTKLIACHDSTITTEGTSTHTITNNGATAYNGGPNGSMKSVSFDGSNDYLSVPDHADFDFGSGAFTIEAWVYANTLGSYNAIAAQWENSGAHVNNSFVFEIVATLGDKVPHLYYCQGGANLSAAITGPKIHTKRWYHLAVVRSGNDFTLFTDGTPGATVTASHTINNSPSALSIGGNVNSAGYWDGYISNLRIVKGQALYSRNFTPPSAAITG